MKKSRSTIGASALLPYVGTKYTQKVPIDNRATAFSRFPIVAPPIYLHLYRIEGTTNTTNTSRATDHSGKNKSFKAGYRMSEPTSSRDTDVVNWSEEEFPTVWAHAVNSLEKLDGAKNNLDITSVECDVMMGTLEHDDSIDVPVPILSHPPNRHSDLTLETLLEAVTEDTLNGKRNLTKNLKLDFKELDALKPSLSLMMNFQFHNPYHKLVSLNADILPGPGKRKHDPSMVPADGFLSGCLEYIKKETADAERGMKFALSLGYKCDYTNAEGYRISDAAAMKDVIDTHHLASKQHVQIILALNARLLARDLGVFIDLLEEYKSASILAWTGSGEPPIPLAEMRKSRDYFAERGIEDRIEFDCCIEN
jgi:Uncharacterized conserved protein (DUF2181)